MPVYNVADYIERCIDNILNQDYQSWELLLVDDGSTDLSGAICDRYACIDERIKVFHKNNGGVSSARNYALDLCNGEYVTFLDSDDYLKLDTLSSSLDILSKNPKIDILDIPYLHFAGNSELEKLVSSDMTYVYYNMDQISNYWLRIPRFESCARIFKKELIKDIRFNCDLKVGEDTVFYVNYLERVRVYATTNKGLYMYCYRDDSVMNTLSKGDIWFHDEKMLNAILNSPLVYSSFYMVFIYRILLSKIRTYNFSIRDIRMYSKYLEIINIRQLFKGNIPLKVKLILMLLKIVTL